jgi:hypothetical protein
MMRRNHGFRARHRWLDKSSTSETFANEKRELCSLPMTSIPGTSRTVQVAHRQQTGHIDAVVIHRSSPENCGKLRSRSPALETAAAWR